MILNKERGGAAREPFEKIHAPIVTVGEPIAAAAFVVPEEALGSFVDGDFLPIRGVSGPRHRPRGEVRGARFLGAIPNLGAGFGDHRQAEKRDENKTRNPKGDPRWGGSRRILIFARKNPAQAPEA